MRKLEDQIGAVSPNPDYPKGTIADNQTLISEGVNGDMIQFFQKMVSETGISENDLPDNETNGYQLLDALIGYITKKHNTWINIPSGSLLNSWAFGGSGYCEYRKSAFNRLEIRLKLESGTDSSIFRLPVALRPSKTLYLGVNSLTSNNEDNKGRIYIGTDGYVRIAPNFSVVANATYWDEVGFNIEFSID